MVRHPFRTEIAPAFFIFLAGILLLLPLRWAAAAVLAAAIHEGGHIAAVRLCGGHMEQARFFSSGACLEASALHGWKALFCILAGPAAGLLTLLAAKWLPRTAVCAAIHSVYNLMPLHSLDGGRAIECILSLWLPRHSAEICRWIHTLCCIFLLFLGFYAAFWLKLGLLPLFAVGLLLIKTNFGKSPCNEAFFALQ